MRYDPALLPTAESFEVLVHAVLEAEHPRARIRRQLPPDWGLDIVLEEDGQMHAYQCKHYRSRNRANLLKAVRESVESALAHRSRCSWRTLTMCISRDLTAAEAEHVIAAVRRYGLTATEFAIRTGTSFAIAVARSPHIWDWATVPIPIRRSVGLLIAGTSRPLVDTERTLAPKQMTSG